MHVHGKKTSPRLAAIVLCLWATVIIVAGIIAFTQSNADFRGRWTQWLDRPPLVDSWGAWDLQFHWVQGQYALRGIDACATQQNPALVDPKLGPLDGIPAYPWAVAEGMLMTWPSSFDGAMVWYLATQILGLAVIGLYCYRQLAPWGVWAGLLAVGFILSMSSMYSSLKWGNYSIFVLVCLLAMVWCVRKRTTGWSVLGGLLLGLALIKPQMAGLFGLYVLVVWRDWLACLVAAALVGALTLAMSWQLSTPPWTLISGVTAYAAASPPGHNVGLLDLLKFVLSKGVVLKLDVILSLGLMFYLFFRFRGLPRASLLVVPALCTMLWSYNNKYDWMILGLIILAGLRLYFAGQAAGRPVAALGWWLVGLAVIVIALMAKAQYVNPLFSSVLQTLERLYFLAAVVYLLRFEAASPRLLAGPEPTLPAA